MSETIYIVASRSGVVLEGFTRVGPVGAAHKAQAKEGARGWVELVVPLDNRVGVLLLVAEAGNKIHDQHGWSLSWPARKGI